MSTLSVSNITDGTDTVGTSYVLNGSAKAWVNFNGTGTIAVRDSLNVSSLTDTATGEYEVNLTYSFTDTDFATSNAAAGGNPLTSSNYNRVMESIGSAVNKLDCITYAPNNAVRVDISHIQITAHGDLA